MILQLSIIIPVYNVEKYISRCLDSLLNQNLLESDYEILIINDGSTDDSISVIEKYALKHKNIKIFNQENKGAGNARNTGIGFAKGNYIYFIDPDDYLANNSLKLILQHAYDFDLDILTFNTIETTQHDLLINNIGNSNLKNLKVLDGVSYIAENGFRSEVWWYIVKNKHINNVGVKLVEGRFLEDSIFSASLILESNRIAHLPFEFHRYVRISSSALNNKESHHYLKVIDDMLYTAISYDKFIKKAKAKKNMIKNCTDRLVSKQQSIVFFMLIRILKSQIKLSQVKSIIKQLQEVKAYPLKSFIGKDYNGIIYVVLVNLFNIKPVFYLMFTIFNPILKKTP